MNFQKPQAPKPKPKPADPDRMPTNEELLHELRLHGAKPPPPREIATGMSRRTRDFLLLAGIGSAVIAFACLRLLRDAADPTSAVKLAATGIAVFCGLLAFVFYGVMSRY